MNLSFKTGLLGGACALALVAVSVPAYAQDDISTLRQQLDAMKERLAKLEADKQDKRRVAAAAAVEAGDKPRSWKLPGTNTSMNIGGFVKMSMYYHFTGGAQVGGVHTEGAGAGVANVSGSQSDNVFNGGSFEFTARRSRFWIQTWTPTDWGEMRTYIEADFAAAIAPGSGSNVLRLRHAYATLGPVLIGKTLTLFGGLIGQPESLDDGAPMAPGALRIEQIRYTHNFGGGLTLSVALEEQLSSDDKNALNTAAIVAGSCPGGVCTNLAAATFNTSNGFFGPVRFPDITAALQWNFPNGAVYVSGIFGMLKVDTGGQAGTLSQNDTAFKWGVAVGARYEIGRLEFGGIGGFGYGIGNKYGNGGASGFTDAVLITQGGASTSADLRAARWFSALGYAQYKLTDTIRVTGAFNWGENALDDEVPGYNNPALNNKQVLTGRAHTYVAAFGNALWNPVPQVTIGVEYSWQFSGRFNSANAQINRIQFAAIYRF